VTKADWIDRIEPHLSESLSSANDRINQSEPVQAWIRRASSEAAEAVPQSPAPGMGEQMKGYAQMTSALELDLPALLEAVNELTDGFGHLELDWRPFNPSLSRLLIAFEDDFSVDVFCRLPACRRNSAQEVLQAIETVLPQGDPFPNRPNAATGFVVHDGNGLGVRVHDHLDQSGSRYQTVSLLPLNQEPVTGLSRTDAVSPLLDRLCAPSDP